MMRFPGFSLTLWVELKALDGSSRLCLHASSWMRLSTRRNEKRGCSPPPPAQSERKVGLPICTLLKKKTCDAFLAKFWNHPGCDHYVEKGRIVFTRTIRSMSEQLAEKARCDASRMQGMGSYSEYFVP
eukprot:1886179-Amphidinium_carterae.1